MGAVSTAPIRRLLTGFLFDLFFFLFGQAVGYDLLRDVGREPLSSKIASPSRSVRASGNDARCPVIRSVEN